MKDKQQTFNTLPQDIQQEIKYYLKYFDSVKVWYENKKYHTTVHEIVKNKYSTDYKFIGEYKGV